LDGCLIVESAAKMASPRKGKIEIVFNSLLRVDASRFTDGCRGCLQTAQRNRLYGLSRPAQSCAGWPAQLD
jgi:hypothetical protein